MGVQGQIHGRSRSGSWEVKVRFMGAQGQIHGSSRSGSWELKVRFMGAQGQIHMGGQGNIHMGGQGQIHGRSRSDSWEIKVSFPLPLILMPFQTVFILLTTFSNPGGWRSTRLVVTLTLLCRSVTDELATLGLAGPRSRHIMAKLVTNDVSDAAFPHLTIQRGCITGVPVQLVRASATGNKQR